MDNNGENLKKVPECGIVDFNDKTKSIPEIRNLEFTPKERGYVEVDCLAHCGGSL
jgi:hypothetical protein